MSKEEGKQSGESSAKEGIKLLILFRTYMRFTKEERREFYEAKSKYYQLYIKFSLIGGCLFSMGYLVSDYQLNGNRLLPTLIPRLSILIPLILYLVFSKRTINARRKMWMDYILGHMMVWATIWAIYHLQIRTHASEGFTIMNLIFLTLGFGSSPAACGVSYLVFLAEILGSNQFNHYANLDVILSLQIPCALAVLVSQMFLTMVYLDHYIVAKRLEKALVTDQLTQLYNRHKLDSMVRCNKLSGCRMPLVMVMLDIDFFKKVNDTFGHYVGDETLVYLGQELHKTFDGENMVFRYGGEEFVILMQNCEVEEAYHKLEEFRKRIDASTDSPVDFTISAGMVEYNGNYRKAVLRVDHALYQAKKHGRNQVWRDDTETSYDLEPAQFE